MAVTLRLVYDKDVLKQQLAEGIEPSEEAFYEIAKADIDLLNQDLPVYKQIKRIYLTEEAMEKTTTMKIKRYKVLNN